MLIKIITLTGISLLLTGCIQDSKASNTPSTDTNTAGKQVSAKAAAPAPWQPQPNITMREASAEVLFWGKYIDPWQPASKHIQVFNNASEFEDTFYQYSIEQVFDVDFKTHSVVLLDMGARNDNHCNSDYRFDTLTAEILTASYTSSEGNPLSTATTRLNIETQQCLSDGQTCTEEYRPHRPYYFFVVERQGELSVSESVSFANCQPTEQQ
ncbi:hypothetical protein [Pseudoalteromonas rubra]|uniref:Lipoprotein n=1 Tax=Pseudoalteromonas rubra TaxID=43658 RepID=A0A5S3X2U0_9GAMM|nr:hypothetical protein [Pseudoalteromonas rubra]TMP38697.1 hypothetical protein CWB98_05960 [Pseudoalteromonas rubra]